MLLRPLRVLGTFTLAVVLAAAGSLAAQSAQPTSDAEVTSYCEHVATLANPFFEGRGSGSKGNDLAADYLEFYYKKAGLKPAFPSEAAEAEGAGGAEPYSSYRQNFTVGRRTAVKSAELSYRGPGGVQKSLAAGTDFNALAISATGKTEGNVVFAGYSLVSGPDGYSTYQENDSLEGKIAMVMRFEPITEEGKSRFSEAGGPRWSNAAALRPKLQAAVSRGAAAIILINPPGADDVRTNNLEDAETSAGFGRSMGVPVVMMSIPAADALIRAGDANARSLEDLRRLADSKGGLIELENATVTIDIAVEEVPKATQNLGGILPGRGELAGQFIVMGAHYDHVGFGRDGGANPANVGEIHPGADDNASGTAGILIAMNKLKRIYEEFPADQPLRSVLFLHFSGEEIGLLGSRHFVRNSPFDAKDIYAMINFDMIGRMRESQVDMNGTGTAVGFDAIVDPLIAQSGLTVKKLTGGQGPSDHQSFYSGGIPVLFFFTGFHDVYHAPGDVASLVNCEGGVQVVELGVSIVQTLASRAGPLEFQETESTWGRADRPRRLGEREREQARQPSGTAGQNEPSDASATPSPGPAMSQMKVRFGIRPNYGESIDCVAVEGVSEGGSAAAAGIKAGDRMLKWNGATLTNMQSWMALLANHNPGDVVDVTIDRGGTEQVIKVTLKAADAGPR